MNNLLRQSADNLTSEPPLLLSSGWGDPHHCTKGLRPLGTRLVGRGSFLFLSYLGRSKDTLFAGYC